MSVQTLDLARQADIAFQANLYTDPNPTRRGLHRQRRDWVESALSLNLLPGASVIEVGIGCGVFTRFLSQLGARITAVDINPAFVLGVQNLTGVTPLLADATRPLGVDGHDLALSTEVLEHVPRQESLAMLRTLHASLKPAGRLVLTTPQRFSTLELTARLLKLPPVLALARRIYGAADELGHINLLTAPELQRQIIAAGFTIERTSRFGFYLPGVAEFGGEKGRRLLDFIGEAIASVPVLRGLLWTQAYILKKA